MLVEVLEDFVKLLFAVHLYVLRADLFRRFLLLIRYVFGYSQTTLNMFTKDVG